MNKYIKVNGHPGLVRDKNSGAILNFNDAEIKQARQRKRLWKEQQEELNSLKQDMVEIKTMISQLLEK